MNQVSEKQTEKTITIEDFNDKLNSLTPLNAVQNFKELIDQATAVGMFKQSEQVIILYRSMNVLYDLLPKKVDPPMETPVESA